MIKSIFLPEKIGSMYLFTKRRVGIEIGTTSIWACIASMHRNIHTIEKVIEEPLETESGLPQETRIINALRSLALKLGPYDELCCVIPSSMVIFKELTLPFIGLKKIKMVVPFEVESLLPFTLDSAVIDCIVTHQDMQLKQTDVLIAAVKRDLIETYRRYFELAEMPLQKLSIDLFELYGLYSFATPKETQNTIALIDLADQTTRIGVTSNRQLKHVRALPKGIGTIVKKLSSLNGKDPASNLEKLKKVGVLDSSDPQFSVDAQKACEDLFADIRFTIEAYTQKLKTGEQLEKIVLTNIACDIPHFAELMTTKLEIMVHPFQPKQLMHSPFIKSAVTGIPNGSLISIGAALEVPLTEDFNLNQEYELKEEENTLNYQLIGVVALLSVILLSFMLYSFLRIRNLRLTLRRAETEAIDELKKSYKLKPGQTANLNAAIKAATNELKKQETAWSRLSDESRYSFLRNLTELSRCINVKDTQLDLTSISMNEDTIKLFGSVPGYQQLTKLQNELECPAFKKLPQLQNWNFKTEPITLTMQKEEL